METGSIFKPKAWATGAKSGSGGLAGIPLCHLLTIWALSEPLNEGAWGSHPGFGVLVPVGSRAARKGRPGSGWGSGLGVSAWGLRGVGSGHVPAPSCSAARPCCPTAWTPPCGMMTATRPRSWRSTTATATVPSTCGTAPSR